MAQHLKYEVRGNKALTFREGQILWIPCEIKQGMFPTERYVSFQVLDEASTIHALIPVEDVNEQSGKVKAVVARRDNSSIYLLFRGEVYAASNPVKVPISWLTQTLL